MLRCPVAILKTVQLMLSSWSVPIATGLGHSLDMHAAATVAGTAACKVVFVLEIHLVFGGERIPGSFALMRSKQSAGTKIPDEQKVRNGAQGRDIRSARKSR